MPSPIKVSLGHFELDLAELVGVIGDLASVKLDQTAKDALQALIAEARKSFDAVVDVLTPLYALNTPATVQAEFPIRYADFKNTYLKNSDEIRTHCHIVAGQIEKLKTGQAWKQNVPLLRNAFQRLEAAQGRWVGNDDCLAASISWFLDDVNRGLTDVLARLQDGSNAACAALSALISDSEPELRRIKSQLDQLSISSAQLSAV